MIQIERALQITLPAHQSAFPDSLTFDLLQTDLMLELAKRPALLRERLLAAPPEKLLSPVILDEARRSLNCLMRFTGSSRTRG